MKMTFCERYVVPFLNRVICFQFINYFFNVRFAHILFFNLELSYLDTGFFLHIIYYLATEHTRLYIGLHIFNRIIEKLLKNNKMTGLTHKAEYIS